MPYHMKTIAKTKLKEEMPKKVLTPEEEIIELKQVLKVERETYQTLHRQFQNLYKENQNNLRKFKELDGFKQAYIERGEEICGLCDKLREKDEEIARVQSTIDATEKQIRDINQGIQDGSFEVHIAGYGWLRGSWARARIADTHVRQQSPPAASANRSQFATGSLRPFPPQ